jgi:ABC-type cobalamin/Fe3+-siderophores transport system ATPase subunit
LQELGAGFSQLVVVLGNALVKQPSLIFIDEPELNLHPALQADFLTSLASYSKYGVSFATHSIGLARVAADRCFTVQKTERGSVVRPIEQTRNYAEFLGSLGIAGLRELGWDRILLVEGPKDVRTFQHLLRLYGKDHGTVVLPLGGDSMVNGKIAHELSEIRRLASRVAAIVDSERDASDKPPIAARSGFAKVCEDLEIPCCVTDRRAIENYLSNEAIADAFGAQALAPFEASKSHPNFWGKGENWRAARLMTVEQLQGTDVGQFLAKL